MSQNPHMKQLITLLAFVGFFSLSAEAQNILVTARIKTPNILCEACKTRVETYLKRIDGVRQVTINYRKGETVVKFMRERTNIEVIKTAIANQGFDADDVTANEESYSKLPITCKKPEDGGKHPKPRVEAAEQ